MEDETTSDDQVKNIKAEFERKTSNLEQHAQQTMTQMERIQAQLESLAAAVAPPAPNSEPDWQSLQYEPEKMAQVIESKLEAKIQAQHAQQSQLQAEQNKVMSEMYTKFPDLVNPSSDLYQKAAEKIGALGNSTPLGIKAAILEAAFELKTPVGSSHTPKASADDFSLGGGGSTGEVKKREGKQRTNISPETLVWSQLLGRNVEDPKVKEGLERAAERKNWRKYQ